MNLEEEVKNSKPTKSVKPPKVEIKRSEDERIFRFVGKIIAAVLVIIVLLMTTCTMHSNTYDAARLNGEMEKAKVEGQSLKERELIKKEEEENRLKTLERLVAAGANPIAVRCAVLGWTDSNDNKEKDVCLVAAANSRINSEQLKQLSGE